MSRAVKKNNMIVTSLDHDRGQLLHPLHFPDRICVLTLDNSLLYMVQLTIWTSKTNQVLQLSLMA